jgi:GT2 family glycosyltransferase
VVDNASLDDSANIIKSSYPWVRLILNNKNLGYAGGNNVGIECANGKYIFLLNQDTEIDPSCLYNLVNIIEKDEQIGICGCKVLLFNNRRYFHYAGGEYNIMGLAVDRGRYESDNGQYDKIEETTFANGAAMLVRKELIQKIGSFDPKFVAYNEDVDLSLRAWLGGYSIVYVPNAVVFHKLGATFGRLSPAAVFHASKNSFIILFKNFNFRTIAFYLPLSIWYRLVLILMNLRKHRIHETKAVVSSLIWVVSNFSHILKERRLTRLRQINAKSNSRFLYTRVKKLNLAEYNRLRRNLFSFDEAKN